jgi:hypothetical protein
MVLVAVGFQPTTVRFWLSTSGVSCSMRNPTLTVRLEATFQSSWIKYAWYQLLY